nr:TonB-dependent receptor [Gemmatimonadales bacterium]
MRVLGGPGTTRRLDGREAFTRYLIAALMVWAAPSSLVAQGGSSVAGTVRSPAGAELRGATVSLSGDQVGRELSQTTATSGRYRFGDLAAGRYTLAVALPGYRQASVPLELGEGEARTLDVTLEAVVLQEIVVTASRDQQEIAKVPAAINVVTRDEIQQGRSAIHLEESLRRVPGVRVEDELGGTTRTRIIIRGSGTRANSPAGSGVRGVRVLVDGIPKNNGGGSAQDLINIDLESAERIEVLRGPSSAIYGNQSGGVVNIITEDGRPGGFFNFRQTVGSYGLFREHAKFGGETGSLNYFASAFRTDQDGYRAQSAFHNTGFHSKVRYRIDDRSHLTTIVSFDRQFSRSPGPLTEAQFLADPKQADSTFAANDVRSTVEEFRLGVIYRRELFGQDALELTGYYIPRHLGPFQQIGVRIPQDFTNRGGGARYLNTRPLGNLANRFTVGAEFQNTPITTGTFNSVTGAALAELEENSVVFGAYVLDELSLRENLQLSVGARFDNIHFTSENLTRATPVASRLYQKFTPKVGIAYQPTPVVSLYATYGRGFEAPVIGELRVLPGGVFG